MFLALPLYFLLALASAVLTGVLYVLGTSIRERFHGTHDVEAQGIETFSAFMRVVRHFTTGAVLPLIVTSAVLSFLGATLPWLEPSIKALCVFSLSAAFTWRRLDSRSVNLPLLLKRKR